MKQVSHDPGIARPEASWDDAVTLVELDDDNKLRHGLARVTSEFMQDAQDAPVVVEQLLDDATTKP